jgi:hypothetical protein
MTTPTSSLSIKKVITEKHSGEWTTVIQYPEDPNNVGIFLDTFDSSLGSLKFLFAIKNNSGSSMNIKNITLSCFEMYSDFIDWTAAISNESDLITNVATKFSGMSSQTIEKTNESDGVGIGTSSYDVSSYNSIGSNQWLVIAINNITTAAKSNKNFSVSVSYT